MSSLPLPSPSFSVPGNLPNVAAPSGKPGDHAHVDNFQDLLAIGMGGNDAPAGDPSANPNLPSNTGSHAPAPAKTSPSAHTSVQNPPPANNPRPQPTQHKQAQASAPQHQDDTQKPASKPSAPSTDAHTHAAQQSDDTASTDDEEDKSTDKTVRSQLQDQLAAISQILLSILPAATPPQPTTTGTPIAATDPKGNMLPALTPMDTSAPQDVLPPQTGPLTATPTLMPLLPVGATDTAPVPPQAAVPLSPEEMDLLKDIQTVIQQMQQQLQTPATQEAGTQAATDPTMTVPSADTTNTTPATHSPDDLQALSNRFQQDVDKLTQLLSQQQQQQPVTTNASATATSVTTMPTAKPAVPAATPVVTTAADSGARVAVPAPAVDNVVPLLKNAVQQVKEQLQKIQSANDKAFATAKSDAQSKSDTLINNALLASGLALKASVTDTTSAATNNVAAAPAVVAPPPVPVNTPPVSAVPFIAQADVSQNGAGNSGDDQKGQGQNMPAASVAPTSNNAGQPNMVANNSPFAKALQAQNASAAPRPVLEQVTFNVKTAIGTGASKIHIQLDPGDLGKLDIKLSVAADGKTGVTITADSQKTLDMLQRDTQGLTKALNDAGLNADSSNLNFNLRGGNGQGQQQHNQQAAVTYQKAQPDDEDGTNLATLSTLSRSYAVNLSEGLDIKI